MHFFSRIPANVSTMSPSPEANSAAEGPLSMKREFRDVLRQLDDLERALRDEEMSVLRLGREIKDLLPCSTGWKAKSGKPKIRR